ncbi:MAG: ABC transporter permease [Fusobacteriaceae bacterium]
MKIENWIALKFITENKKKILFIFFAIVVSTAVIFLSLAIKMSISKTIKKDLRAMGKNSILIGGDVINKRDIAFIKSIPDVDYYFYIDQIKKEDENLFKAYPSELLDKMKLPILRKNDVILDSTQFLNKQVGDTISFFVNKEKKEFLIRGFYKELNPLETMKVGNRILMSEEGFESNILNVLYSRVAVVFKDEVDSKEYVDLILNNLNKYRENKITLLETPEIYKKMNSIIAFLDKTLQILLILAVLIGGFFVFNTTMSSLLQRKSSIGILSAIGMSKKRIFRLFLIQNLYILVTGIFVGIVSSFLIIHLLEKMLKIEILIDGCSLSIVLSLTVVLGVVLGVVPIKKMQKESIIELLKV